jgi:hypothetical protein
LNWDWHSLDCNWLDCLSDVETILLWDRMLVVVLISVVVLLVWRIILISRLLLLIVVISVLVLQSWIRSILRWIGVPWVEILVVLVSVFVVLSIVNILVRLSIVYMLVWLSIVESVCSWLMLILLRDGIVVVDWLLRLLRRRLLTLLLWIVLLCLILLRIYVVPCRLWSIRIVSLHRHNWSRRISPIVSLCGLWYGLRNLLSNWLRKSRWGNLEFLSLRSIKIAGCWDLLRKSRSCSLGNIGVRVQLDL